MVIYAIGTLIQLRTILVYLLMTIYYLIKNAIWMMIALYNVQKPK